MTIPTPLITCPLRTAIAVASALALIATPLSAQDAQAGSDRTADSKPPKELQNAAGSAGDPWQFTIAPLLWFSAINGNTTVRGRTTDFNVGFDELFQHFDGGFMAYLEARKGKFGFYSQPSYMKLEFDGNAGPIQGSVDLRLWLVEVGGFYQLVKVGEDKPLEVDALLGMRYWNVQTDVNLNGTVGNVVNFSASSTVELYDPLIGLSVQKHLTRKLSLVVRGDVGGFGVSDKSSDLSWQAIALIGYDFTRHFSLYAGYRALSLRKDSGSGSAQSGADFIMNGGLLGFDFHF